MKITIHRGIDQIGGCITEIESKKGTKILIDLGHNLPEGDATAEDKYDNPQELDRLLRGVSHIFYSHYHGDHLGFEAKVPKEIKQHIGELSLQMVTTLKSHMIHADSLRENAEASLEALSRFEPYKPKITETYGDIQITPYPISHSAIDAYMFVIECDGVRILHTGDFRDHGYHAKELLKDVENDVGNIHVLITEGTMLSRNDKRLMTEESLQEDAYKLFKEYKYTFVLCSSMDADRLLSFFLASQRVNRYRRFLTDGYQVDQIQNIKKLPEPYNKLFAFPFGRDKEEELSRMKRNGFTMLVRCSESFEKRIDEIMHSLNLDPQKVLFVYSMFSGYIDKSRTGIYREKLYQFVHRYDWTVERLHTSGHASKEALQAICEHIIPIKAIIPIHKEKRGLLDKLSLKVDCPIIESSCTIDNIEITII